MQDGRTDTAGPVLARTNDKPSRRADPRQPSARLQMSQPHAWSRGRRNLSRPGGLRAGSPPSPPPTSLIDAVIWRYFRLDLTDALRARTGRTASTGTVTQSLSKPSVTVSGVMRLPRLILPLPHPVIARDRWEGCPAPRHVKASGNGHRRAVRETPPRQTSGGLVSVRLS